MDCPYYAKVQEPIARHFVKGYCQGCPASGMMVPSLKEEKNYCLRANGFLECPIYRSKLTRAVDINPEVQEAFATRVFSGMVDHEGQEGAPTQDPSGADRLGVLTKKPPLTPPWKGGELASYQVSPPYEGEAGGGCPPLSPRPGGSPGSWARACSRTILFPIHCFTNRPFALLAPFF